MMMLATLLSKQRRRRRRLRCHAIGVLLAFAVLTTATDSFVPTTPGRAASPLQATSVIPLPLHTNQNTIIQRKKKRQPKSAKDVWAERYCSVEGLREAFGKNRNRLWGDLDASTTRRLYKRLLPVILLDLRDQYGMDVTELAPLAYKARLAAKLYARERSVVPARVFANALDGARHFFKYGEIDFSGMSYQQLFEKYAEKCETSDERKVCAKILERSCVSNERIDQLCQSDRLIKWKELEDVSFQCEEDIRQLLQLTESLQNFRALRSIAKVKRRISAIQRGLLSCSSKKEERQ